MACGARVTAAALATMLAAMSGCRERGASAAAMRKTPDGRAWAKKLALDGVENFHQVSDDLYRGAQPSREGFRRIEAMGIRTVVSLRSFHGNSRKLEGTGLDYERMTVKAYHPEDKEVIRFLQIVSDPSCTPVFVHCMEGSDRTGLMCAAYRVAIQGWAKEDAIEEMALGGFGHHKEFKNLRSYFRKLDMADIKRRAGLANGNGNGGQRQSKVESQRQRQSTAGEGRREDAE